MSMLDDFMGKVSESNVSDADILKFLDLTDVFAKEHLDNPEILAQAAEVRAALIGKMNNKDIVNQDMPEPALGGNDEKGGKNNKPMDYWEYVSEIGKLGKLENSPAAYMDKCEEILKNPRDVTLAEQAIYGAGRVVESNPTSEVARRAIRILELCTNNKELIKLDTEHPHIQLIEDAMKFTAEKIENCPVKSSAWKVAGYVKKYSDNRLHTVMDNALKEKLERDASRTKVVEPALRKNDEKNMKKEPIMKTSEAEGVDTVYVPLSKEERAELMQRKAAKEKALNEMKQRRSAASQAVVLDEEKLPKIKLAGNAGKDSVVFDLSSIADELKALKPGEKLALGRDPEKKLGKDSCKVKKIGENNNFISRHHCDIRRTYEGKLVLIDHSMNGTEVMANKSEKIPVQVALGLANSKSARQ